MTSYFEHTFASFFQKWRKGALLFNIIRKERTFHYGTYKRTD